MLWKFKFCNLHTLGFSGKEFYYSVLAPAANKFILVSVFQFFAIIAVVSSIGFRIFGTTGNFHSDSDLGFSPLAVIGSIGLRILGFLVLPSSLLRA